MLLNGLKRMDFLTSWLLDLLKLYTLKQNSTIASLLYTLEEVFMFTVKMFENYSHFLDFPVPV